MLRCSYLTGKLEAIFDLPARGPYDIKKLRDEFDDNYNALAEIYGGIKDDFERCINIARTARDTQAALSSESQMRVRDG